MLNYTTKTKLVCQERSPLDYTTYVFELLDETEINRLGYKYIMCIRWPNWDHRFLENGEEGYLYYSIVTAGQDSWYANGTYTPYKTSFYQFNRFISEQPKQPKNSFKL